MRLHTASVGIGVVGLLNGLVHLHDGFVAAIIPFSVGLVALTCFIVYQRRRQDGLINMSLFRYRQFAMGALVAFIYGAGLFGSTYLFPVYMQMALQYSPSEAGLVLLPAGIVLAITIVLAGRLADRLAPNMLVAFGLFLLTLSFALMATGSESTAYVTLMIWAIIGRIGLGCVLPALSLGTMRGIESELIAQGASAINFLRQLGGALGVSLVGVVLEWRLAAYPASSASGRSGTIQAFNETFLFVTLLCGLAIWAALQMKPAVERVK